MRGDRPDISKIPMTNTGFTPHARGSTHCHLRASAGSVVYPACAGIDPYGSHVLFHVFRLPRMRGDRPLIQALVDFVFQFTPHARGSTILILFPSPKSYVYPACAGIDRSLRSLLALWLSLPRMRGDRPR